MTPTNFDKDATSQYSKRCIEGGGGGGGDSRCWILGYRTNIPLHQLYSATRQTGSHLFHTVTLCIF